MSLRRRVSALIASGILVVGVAVTAGFFYLQRSLQPRSGSVAIAGLTAPVTVEFDKWAIPWIRAANDLDAARAQGFVHASERLWQLEFFHRIARGRLAEVFGEPMLETDRLLRTLDLWGGAARELAGVSPFERAVLRAYADGVNARIASWRGPWPPEFLLLGIDPDAWSPQSSLAIGRILALDLSGWRTELSRTSALARLGSDRRSSLEAGYPAWGPTITQGPPPEGGTPPRARSVGSGTDSAVVASARLAPLRGDAVGVDPLRFLSTFAVHASNSWAVGGSRTADGHPLLANDMHLALRAPSTWYLNSIVASESDQAVAGLSIPGAPGVVVGLNRHLAWAFTNAMVDDADFVVEAVNLDGSMYRDPDGWKSFEIREETIHIRGRAAPEIWPVRSTARGPVITDIVRAGGLTLSLLWTGFEPRGAVSALLDMNRASDADGFERAVERFRSPHQNVIFATTDDQIGYRMSGSVPIRGPGQGAVPISFERLPNGWPGFWPPDSMPALRNPSSDYLVSANNLQSWAAFGRVGVDYPAPFRARRIEDRVSRATGWTVDHMRDLQIDSYSLWAERLRPRAVAAARRAGADSLATVLERWNLRTEIDAIGAAPFYVWLYRLRELIVSDEFDQDDGWFPDLAFLEILASADSPWVDDPRTAVVESLDRLEEEAARTAASVVGRVWGDVHRERSAHPLGRIAILDRIFRFHVGPYPARGGRHTVRPDDPSLRSRLDSAAWALPTLGEYGPSQRFVAHLGPDGPRGYFLLPTGQAGNPLDPHYRDMAEIWASSPLIEVTLDRRPEAPRSVLRLTPGSR